MTATNEKAPARSGNSSGGVNSNPNSQKEHSSMTSISPGVTSLNPPAWARTSKIYHGDLDVAAEHHGPAVGVRNEEGIVSTFVNASQLEMRDGTSEAAVIVIERDGEGEFEFPLAMAKNMVSGLQDLLDRIELTEAGQ